MSRVLPFHKAFPDEAQQYMRERAAVKNFADKLSEARERDALAFVAELTECFNTGGKPVDLILNKLYDLGYREAVQLFKEKTGRA